MTYSQEQERKAYLKKMQELVECRECSEILRRRVFNHWDVFDLLHWTIDFQYVLSGKHLH